MTTAQASSQADRQRALRLRTIAFTTCFADWMIFSIISLAIREQLNLSQSEFGLLVAMPILSGSLTRLILGIWTEQYGGRLVFSLQMLLTAGAVWLLTYAQTYPMFLLAALGIGLAGESFAIGVAYVLRWFPKESRGTALGVFGMGNVGAAVTKFLAPFVMVAWGWQAVAHVWTLALVVMAVVFFVFAKDDPAFVRRKAEGGSPLPSWPSWSRCGTSRSGGSRSTTSSSSAASSPWRSGGRTTLSTSTEPMWNSPERRRRPSAFRPRSSGPTAEHLSDRLGARKVMCWTFGFSMLFLFMLSHPPTDYVIHGRAGDIAFSTQMDLWPFIGVIFALGFFMSLGKTAVFKHIPVYYPENVGAVGGLVGLVGGLGGFILPIAFGALLDLTKILTSCFAFLLLIVAVALAWMRFTVRWVEQAARGPALDQLPELPEFAGLHEAARHALLRTLDDWRPEDSTFWAEKGRKVARRNLWISIPALLLAFAVWMVWSVVVARLPAIGFGFTSEQLFWLAALPALSGATLRIFYGFMVPIFGGRLWTTLSTASLLIPALGIGYTVQDPGTPYLIFLALALLCGLPTASSASRWYNAGFLILWGSNVPQTRTPDAHFYTEARYRGAKSAVICPDYSEAAKFGDIWLSPKAGTDSALAMTMGHVILREFHLDRQAEYFEDYCRRYTDMSLLVKLEERDGRLVPGRMLRAGDFADALGEEDNPGWKTVEIDEGSGRVGAPTAPSAFAGRARAPRN